MILGQIEQVVSSADCRSAEQSRAPDHANHTRNRDGGAAGTLSSLGQSAELLELEDRLLVAFAGRGRLRIAQLIENVFGCPNDQGTRCLFYCSDERFVEAVERFVASHEVSA